MPEPAAIVEWWGPYETLENVRRPLTRALAMASEAMSVGLVHSQIRPAEKPLNMAPPDVAAAQHPRRARSRPPTRRSPPQSDAPAAQSCSSAPRTVIRGASSTGACVSPSLRRHRSNVLNANPFAAQKLPRVWLDRTNRSISFRHCAASGRTRCLVPLARLMIPLATVSWDVASESDGTPDQNNGLFCSRTLLRLYEGCARGYIGRVDGANLIKLHTDEPKISYLLYPDFESDPHPALSVAMTVHLQTFRVRERDYTSSPNPPILHRKKKFVGLTHPLHAKIPRLIQQEESKGLYAPPNDIGTRNSWNDLLYSKGLSHRGHRLIPKRAPH